MKKILIAVLVILSFPLCGNSQAAQRIYTALTPTGNGSNFAQVIPGASVYVCAWNSNNTCGSQVTIYSDINLSTPITQPLIANTITGVYQYYIQSGTRVIEEVCAPYSQCTFNSVMVGNAGTGGVSQIVAGTNVTISPGSGTGVVTVNSTGGVTSVTPGSGITCSPLVGGSCTGAITISLASTFTINSFTGCGGSLELGQSIINPTCSATYSSTPASASITNTDGIDSPLTLLTPFTSGTIVGTFTHSAVATTTVQLTAVGSTTQTANQTYTWNPRIFSGLGSAGATSTVTASGTNAVLSTGDSLPSAGLGSEVIGQTFGPFLPSGQNIYLLLTGGSHTFIDALTGFPFAMNAPITVTFVNQYGVTVTMYLYQSTNSLTGTFEPRVAS